MSPLRSRAKARILRWFDTLSAPGSARQAMARSIDVMLDELPNRDDRFEVMTVALGESENLPLACGGPDWRVFPCADLLAVTTIVPGWTKGWRSIIKDEFGNDQLTWFLHYARQYVHRSHVAKVLMIAWDRDGRVLHPFGPHVMSRFHGPSDSDRSPRTLLDLSVADARRKWGPPPIQAPTRSIWTKANTLDPALHQAIFHFTRAQSLLSREFELEAVVAFDCVFQAIKTLLVRSGLATSGTTRSELCLTLGLGAPAANVATEGHFLRNTIGAHAGGWRWWDSGEITEDLVPALAKTARRALSKAASLEPQIRKFDPGPASWSDWLLGNFDMIWDTVWFDKLHTLPRR